MVQRLRELRETGAREKDNLDRMQDLCSSLEQDREAFKGSLDRAQKLHRNLQSRCSLWSGSDTCQTLPGAAHTALCSQSCSVTGYTPRAFPGAVKRLSWQGMILWPAKRQALL